MLDKLKEPFPPEMVKWRVGSTSGDKKRGLALAYIDARAVMNRLDDVLGDGWQDSYAETTSGRVISTISIKVDDEWRSRSDGAGDTGFEGEKGGLSDAFKRAAVKWGIGRYLYDLDAVWVDIKKAGKSYAIADHEMPRLQSVLEGEAPKKQRKSKKQPDPSTNGNGRQPGLYFQGDEVLVKGKEDEVPGVVVEMVGDLVSVSTGKGTFSVRPERLTLVESVS